MKRSTTKAVAAILLLTAAAAAIGTGCETVKGAGKDIQYAGEKTQDAIDDAKK